MLDHHMVDRRIGSFRSNSVTFRQHHQEIAQFPRAIIGRSFGPFTRCASQSQLPVAFRRQKSIAAETDIILNVNAGGGDLCVNDKLQLVTSTQNSIDCGTTEPDTAPIPTTLENVAKTEEINERAFNNRTTKTKAPTTALAGTDYKFLRRQFSMDQRQNSFATGPAAVVAGSRWRGPRFESVDLIRSSAVTLQAPLGEEDWKITSNRDPKVPSADQNPSDNW